ncbi:T9SS type A sorting domain-containing protein [Hymenobacter swuensis]|uniref:Secretion system C-terminal sorting domain-containing protein n=1 Tax=Hymenobacter swuensis DY53 TaxID=1227739 RepID=W8F6V3_9BACT|nr:T9SS type A sorting domain-containing protein [Hymenobacter swuensis]AHJ99762.1 hypothetical protein Hsw_4167 [Hymenobacter swuensis DY53]
MRHKPLSRDGSFAVLTYGAGYGEIRITATNACGSTGSTLPVTVTQCDYSPSYTVYPNPARDEATVVATEPAPAARAITAPGFDVVLYNEQGRRVYQGRSQHGQAKLPLRELPAGLYQLHAGQGNRQERHTVQVRP